MTTSAIVITRRECLMILFSLKYLAVKRLKTVFFRILPLIRQTNRMIRSTVSTAAAARMMMFTIALMPGPNGAVRLFASASAARKASAYPVRATAFSRPCSC